ncbi:phosphoadenosine phosphosulfate reductase family protein [Gilvimarinus sp. DA14]|uniref:phosphoadenosine phosphosulfate reductase domain-containing protein n=1 Tax=Gilvimarinus sp. DA14 TaxID=2956798 RepID=UPI0020B69DC7|nr:phosphoadenosine phosphosulfate reductase family protein [Gilvimarinus sp. DA14]UTF60608.1 phosphoadenosine phosphosulfate reductase family protein [Gilvimarinus sp. DA14]
MPFSLQKIATLNTQLRDSSPGDIIAWACEQKLKTVCTTNFGPHEAAVLQLVSQHGKNTPIICVDHGYNTKTTYQIAEELTQRFQLNVDYFTPKITSARRQAVLGGFPDLDDEVAHKQFTQEVKLEPFARAFAQYKPDIWITGIRKDQTEHRANLDILSLDNQHQCLKVAPFFHWGKEKVENYMREHDLPIVVDYFDPTKVLDNRECGLQLG